MTDRPDNHDIHPPTARWTHIALPASDIDASLAWYGQFTPWKVLDRREDAEVCTVWLGHDDQAQRPFVLVLVSFVKHRGRGPLPTLAPFAHLGIELPSREAVDRMATLALEADCLVMPPTDLAGAVGYVCIVRDPDGNMLEFSYDQGVYAKAREAWG